MQTKPCLHCSNVMIKKVNESKEAWKSRRKFCSRQCANLAKKGIRQSPGTEFKKGSKPVKGFQEGHNPWNKGLSVHLSPESEFKPFQLADEKHPKWKGDEVGKKSLHAWVRRKKSAYACTFCHRTKHDCAIDMANIDHTYQRNLEDFIPLCRSCHRKHDMANNGYVIKI